MPVDVITLDLDTLAAESYERRSPWSRIEGHKWHQLHESSRDGWRDQAKRQLIRQGYVIIEEDAADAR